MSKQKLQDDVMSIILKLDTFVATKDFSAIADARRSITALHKQHPVAAEVLWGIAIKLQRDLLSPEEVPA